MEAENIENITFGAVTGSSLRNAPYGRVNFVKLFFWISPTTCCLFFLISDFSDRRYYLTQKIDGTPIIIDYPMDFYRI